MADAHTNSSPTPDANNSAISSLDAGRLHPRDLPEPARAALTAYRRGLAEAPNGRSPVPAGQVDAPLMVAWAPGRANLIGEHTDYNLGWVLPVAIDRVVAIVGRPTTTPSLSLYSTHHKRYAHYVIPPDMANVEVERALPYWARYIQGVWRELARQGALPPTTRAAGMTAVIAGNAPVGGGLSSSAALEVAAATFAEALGGLALPPLTLAQACQRAEQWSVGAQVGIMDQAASRLGRPGHALLLDCRSLDYEYIPFDLPEIVLAVYDTRVPHTLATSGYNERRRQCEEAVALLAPILERETPGRTVAALRDVTADDLARHAAALPPTLLRRAWHVVSENARTLAAADALRAGDAAALGALLYASHASLRDDYAVSCPELDAVVEIAREVPGVVGARMMGAGFGGNVLALVRQSALPALSARLAAEYPRRTGRVGELRVCQIGGGPKHATVTGA